MHMWFSEYHTSNVRLDVRIEEQLFSGQSDYQKIDVFKSYEFGKMVAIVVLLYILHYLITGEFTL